MASGGKRLGAGRPAGTQNKTAEAVKAKAVSYFAKLLDDETEAKFWRYFMSGYVVDVEADGTQRIIPIPINPVSWAAFKRAVEYKRGMPVQTVVGGGENGQFVVRFETVGANAEVLAAKARTLGLGS